ncbi:hypothetical protein PENSUB_9618 [Penicillium subrubescens]|uniref:Uncharacterized protein n=1 Tax=Penicillium subrubescens TaxID=1316194 RepID=A0A1Q5TCU7_9EURO|nr:hypothetical protein PENSUB_9618 [Penicillium subrubescens]
MESSRDVEHLPVFPQVFVNGYDLRQLSKCRFKLVTITQKSQHVSYGFLLDTFIVLLSQHRKHMGIYTKRLE